MERMRPGETEKTRHNNSSLDMVTVDSNVETSDDLGREEEEKEITAAETSSEEREGGNFTFQSRNADLNTSGPGAKVSTQMQVVFKHPVCSLFSVLSNPSSATTTRTSHTKSEVQTSRTGQREKSILGTPGLNSTCLLCLDQQNHKRTPRMNKKPARCPRS